MLLNQQQTSSFDYSKLNVLSKMVCNNIDELIDKLEIQLIRSGKLYRGRCCVHCGDNYSALNLYPEGDSVPGYWCCRTHHCERNWSKTIIGFVRGVLSRKLGRVAKFWPTVNWLCKFVNKPWDKIEVDRTDEEIQNFINQGQIFKKVDTQKKGLSKDVVRRSLIRPPMYYLARGYSEHILDIFDIGLCTNPTKVMFGRVVVPIYDESGKIAIAFTGRSIYNQCRQCKAYHKEGETCVNFSKWHHVGNVNSTLYNIWNAKKYIQEQGSIVLVEGPGDVWRLEEAGVKNAVGMFGTDITDEQQIMIEKSGAMKIYLIKHNDTAGELSEKNLRAKLCYYNFHTISPATAKDVGELSIERVQKEIIPCL